MSESSEDVSPEDVSPEDPTLFDTLQQANEICRRKGGREWIPHSERDEDEWISYEECCLLEDLIDRSYSDRCQDMLKDATRFGLADFVDLLFYEKNMTEFEITPDVVAAAHSSDCITVFDVFVWHGWDINENPEMTSLSRAVADQNLKLVEWHLANDADPNLHTGAGGDPLTTAASLCNLPLVKMLVEHKGKPEVPNENKAKADGLNEDKAKSEVSNQNKVKLETSNALIAATASKNDTPEVLEIMKYLLDKGVDVNRVEERTDPDADVDSVSIFEGTALHKALERNDMDRLKLLVERGADPRIEGSRGKSSIEIARMHKQHEMLLILVRSVWFLRRNIRYNSLI